MTAADYLFLEYLKRKPSLPLNVGEIMRGRDIIHQQSLDNICRAMSNNKKK